MHAIVLAAGEGPRLRPLTEAKPTALVEVDGRPVLDRALGALREAGIGRIAVCAGHRADAVTAFCGARFGRSEVEVVAARGGGPIGALAALYPIRERLAEDCALVRGDVVWDAEILRGLLRLPHSGCAVSARPRGTAPWRAIVRGGRVERLVPAPANGAPAVGLYTLRGTAGAALVEAVARLAEPEGGGDREIEAILDRLCARGRLQLVPHEAGSSRWYGIDTVDDLLEADLLFNAKVGALAARRIAFLDRDGTLALGGRPLPGARRFIAALRRRGVRLFVMTNNSSRTRRQHLDGLSRCGIEVGEEEILLSTDVAAEYLVAAGLRRVYWVATVEVGEYLRSRHGLEFEAERPSAVLLTYDTTLDYGKLSTLTRHLQRGVPYFATHADLVCPDAEGPLPDAGAFLELLRAATGRTPELVFGKPHRAMVDAGLARAGGGYRDAMVIGDRLYTDVAVAEGTEMLSVLVLSGETTRAQYEVQTRRADVVVRDLDRLCQLLESGQ
jgi:HAD superfamily hydrolase (TIGR01450 family)